MSTDEPNCEYRSLATACAENRDHFKSCNEPKYQQLIAALTLLETAAETAKPVVEELRALAPAYDFKDVPANGYRSYVKVADRFREICSKAVAEVTSNRRSIFFQKMHYTKQIASCAQTFATLNIALQMVQRLHEVAPDQSLFLEDPKKIDELEDFMKRIDIKDFYGQFTGFQYCESVQSVMRMVSVLMATYAQHYYHEKSLLRCVAMSSRYMKDPELRAEQVAQVAFYRKVSVDFCKKFWNLSDHAMLAKMRKLIKSKCVNQPFEIPCETLEYYSNYNTITIPPATVHLGLKPTKARLYSSFRRRGMEYFKKLSNPRGTWKPQADWLIIHIHGGGFVAQSSESHQPYLTNWTKWTNDTPILSIDYSLAPEAPYPRALDEVFHAYVWALNNCHHLGTSAKRIVFAGDSAGANLCVAVALKCIQMKVRLPDGIFCAYIPSLLRFYPSPSRFLSFMDPALPFGFLGCVLKAYTQIKEDPSTSNPVENIKRSVSFEQNDLVLEKNRSADCGNPGESAEGSSNGIDKNGSSSDSANVKTDGRFKSIVQNMLTNAQDDVSEKKPGVTRKGVPEFENFTSISEILAITQDSFLLSPANAEDSYLMEMPPMVILTVEMDLCLDDCVLMAKRLDKLNKKVHLDVLEGLNHGFMNFIMLSKDAHSGCVMCAQRIKELLEGEPHNEFKITT